MCQNPVKIFLETSYNCKPKLWYIWEKYQKNNQRWILPSKMSDSISKRLQYRWKIPLEIMSFCSQLWVLILVTLKNFTQGFIEYIVMLKAFSQKLYRNCSIILWFFKNVIVYWLIQVWLLFITTFCSLMKLVPKVSMRKNRIINGSISFNYVFWTFYGRIHYFKS